MDVRLPDGTIVRNVPEGTTQSDLMERINKITPEDFARIKAQGNVERPRGTAYRTSGETALTPAEEIAANPYTRFAIGAAKPVLGVTQLVEQAVAGRGPMTQNLEQLAEITKRGREYVGSTGMDPFDVAGQMVSPVPLAASRAMPATASALGRIGQGSAFGAGAGALSPVESGDFWEQKQAQIGAGGLAGALLPAGWETAKGVGRGVRDISNLFTDSGAGRILSRYQQKIVGDQGIPPVTAALRGAGQPLPGYQPTAAEAVAKVPAGSPILAHQKITAGTAGGPSAAFGQRVLDQKAAIAAAETARDVATTPMRDAAIKAANSNGVKSTQATAGIDAILQKPGLRASDVVEKTLNDIKEKITKFTDKTSGVIDANDLYTIRKEIGTTIKSHAKETANWDKRLASGLERDIQKSIDDAIVGAGGTGWKQYLNEFAARSQMIEKAKDAVKAAAKPAQRTNLGGGMNVTEESRLHLPQMLSRPMMLANAVMSKLGRGIEPALDKEATRRYLNPQALADALEKLPIYQRKAAIDQLMRYQGILSERMVEENARGVLSE